MGRIIPSVKNFIINDNVMNELDKGSSYKVCFLKASSGCGKTSIVSKWVEKSDFSTVFWYSFKKIDNIPSLFFKNFFGSLKNKLKNNDNFNNLFDRYSDTIISSEEIAIVTRAINDYQLRVVLDDFQNLSAEAIKYIRTFIEVSSYKIKIIILSRNEIPVEFSELYMREEIYFIEKKLAFGYLETKDYFFKRNINLSDSEINKVINYTNGWLPAYISISRTISNDIPFEGHIDDKYLFNYIKESIWDNFDNYTKSIFIVSGILSEISIEMLSSILEIDKDIVINTIIKNEDFFVQKSERKYVLIGVMRDYINNYTSKEELKYYNLLIGRYYYKKEKDLLSIKYYIASEEYNEIINPLNRINKDNNFYESELFTDIIFQIPNDVIKNNPLLMVIISISSFEHFHLNVTFYWVKELIKYKENNPNNLDIYKMLGYLILYDLRYSNHRLLNDSLKAKHSINEMGLINPCLVFPSVLRGLRDFSDVNDFATKSEKVKEILSTILGDSGQQMFYLAIAEMKLEKNFINDAIIMANNIIYSNAQGISPEICVVASNIIVRGLLSLGEIKNAERAIMLLKRIIITKDALKYLPNFRALSTRYYQKINDVNVLDDWLKEHANKTIENVSFNDLFVLSNKVRVLIYKNEFREALKYVDFLIGINKSYKRTVDLAEMFFARSCILYHFKDKNYIIDLNNSLDLLMPLEYKLIYFEYESIGFNVLTDALDIVKQNKRNYIFNLLKNKGFERIENKKMYKSNELKDLSKTEIKVLRLIEKGYSNLEIAEEFEIKITTVKTHVSNIFEKLNVKNRSQAVKIAREFDVI